MKLDHIFRHIAPFLLFCGPAISAAFASQLRIVVIDEKGAPIWTRLEVRSNDRTFQPASDAIVVHTNPRQPADINYTGSFVVRGNGTVEVPPGNYTIVAEHGLEYERVERLVRVASDRPATVEIQLHPWIRMRERGWYSGDMHVHREPADTTALTLAEDLNISVDFTIWNKRDLWNDRALRAERIVQISPDRFVTLMNAEDERGHGAWMLHNLKRPLEQFAVDGRWYPSGLNFIRAAREQKNSPDDLFPWFDSEKPIWWGLPVMMALAPPDSIGIVHNHFNQYSMVTNEAWGRPRDQAKFPGQEGFTDYSLQLYYRYLNLGFRIPPSAGSASGVLPNPVGYNRMYVLVGGPLTVEKWYTGIKAGKVLVTNGPILFLNVRSSSSKLTTSVEAHAREPIDRIEIVANGRVIHSFRPEGFAKNFEAEISVDAGNYSWVAARCFLRPEGTIRFAHTSPVYLGGKWDASADAQYFVAWIDDLIADTNSGANHYASEVEKQQNLTLYRQAREFYATRVR